MYDSISVPIPIDQGHAGGFASDRRPTGEEASSTSRQRRRRARAYSDTQSESEDGTERIPVPPIPDLRYEQGVLASLQPFLHRVPATASATAEAAGDETEKHERKVETAEKVSLAARNLTAEGTSAPDRPSDIFLGPLRIEWTRVAYVIVRDQVRSLNTSLFLILPLFCFAASGTLNPHALPGSVAIDSRRVVGRGRLLSERPLVVEQGPHRSCTEWRALTKTQPSSQFRTPDTMSCNLTSTVTFARRRRLERKCITAKF